MFNWIKGVFAQVNPFDGGKNFRTYNPRKKREDEERNQAPTYNAPNIQQQQQNQQQQRLKAQRPDNMFKDLNATLRIPGQQQEEKKKTEKERELEDLYQKNLERARQDAKKEQEQTKPKDLLGKIFRATNLDGSRRATENSAQQKARIRASRQYQDRHGWNGDETVKRANRITTAQADKNALLARKAVNRVNVAKDVASLVAGGAETAADLTRSGVAGIRDVYDWARTGEFSARHGKEAEDVNRYQRIGITGDDYDRMVADASRNPADIANRYINPETNRPYTMEEATKLISDTRNQIGVINKLQSVDQGLGALDFIPGLSVAKQGAAVPIKSLYRNAAREALERKGREVTAKNIAKRIAQVEATKLGVG